jgi:N-methylhydantoinase A/oxoprolinase/acetone carboxylase beta subunit
MKLWLGIDVGGSNTDAVVLDEHATLVARLGIHTDYSYNPGVPV